MPSPRRDRSLAILTGVLLALALVANPLRAQAPTGPDATVTNAKGGGPRTVIPAQWHVDDDNAGAQDGSALRPYRTVQQAIDAAADNAVIAVAGGNYPQNIRLLGKTVRLYGGYMGGTAAGYAGGTAGNFSVRDPATHPSLLKGNGKDSVVTMSESGASIVDGFVVTGGGRSAVAAPLWLGGGFYIDRGSPTISNNVIEKNQTCPPVLQDQEKLGGGIYSVGASISILDNIIRNNVSGRGAAVAVEGPKVVIRGNTVQNNVAVSDHGGGLYIFSKNAEVSHNVIVGNEIGRALGYGWGGGVIVFNKGGFYKFSHNVFTGNFAPSAGSALFVDDGAVASSDHDLFYDNACNPKGDGAVPPIYVDGSGEGFSSSLEITHATVADHTCQPATGGGSAIRVTDKSRVVVKNSILWNNGDDDIKVDATSRATVSYTLTQKTVKGVGNISRDPLFANALGRDYRLRSTAGRWDPAANDKNGAWTLDSAHSPAIDAGDPASPFTLEPVPHGTRVNLGAFGNTTQASKAGSGASQGTGPSGTPETGPAIATTYLLRGTTGELPSEVGDDGTKLSAVTSKELGGPAIQIDLIDTFGQRKCKIEDWTSFSTLRLDIVHAGAKDLALEFNLFHSGTKAYATRVVAPFVLKPGKNEVRIAVKDLKNSNGSLPDLTTVRRWYVSSSTPAKLFVGDIYLEGKPARGTP